MQIKKEDFKKIVPLYKGFALSAIISIICFTILMFIFPPINSLLYVISAIIALLFISALNIVRFAASKSHFRPGWLILNAVVSLLIALLFFIAIFQNKIAKTRNLETLLWNAQNKDQVIFWAVVYFGWYTLFKGIFRFAGYTYRVKAGSNKAYEISVSVLSVILGILITVFPFWKNHILNYFAIYLIPVSFTLTIIMTFFDLIYKPDIVQAINHDIFKDKYQKEDKDIKTVDAKPIENPKENK